MSKKLDSIQVLRGFAALSVVMFHYRSYLVPDGSDRTIPDMIFGWGSVGVDLFFVISGFIMYYVTHDKTPGLKTGLSFLYQRALRIIPTYYIILLITFLIGGAMSTFHYPEKVTNLISAITFKPYLPNTAPLYIHPDSMFNVRWTLNYEVYFYLSFAICLCFTKKTFAFLAWLLAPLVYCYITLGKVSLSTSGYNFDNIYSRLITNPIILEFGMGVFTCMFYFAVREKTKNLNVLLPLFIFIVTFYLVISRTLTSYNVNTGLMFSLLLLTFVLCDAKITSLIPRLIITLGNVSFSLYLLHIPLASFISKKAENIQPNIMHNPAGYVFLIAISIIVSVISHKYLELRLSSVINRKVSLVTLK